MKNFKQLLTTAALVFGLTSAPGWAATLNIVGGQLVGASGVSVAGSLYDVTFEEGTCAAVFDGCDEASDFTFQTPALAVLASQALLDTVFIDFSGFNVGSDPDLLYGISSTLYGQTVTFYGLITDHLLQSSRLYNYSLASAITDFLGTGNFPWSADTSLNWKANFAKWTPVAVVPLPAGGLLLLSALGGMAALRRRKKHTA